MWIPPLCFTKQSPVYGKEASGITFQKEVQNLTVGRKNDDAFLGCTRANFGTLHYGEVLWDQLKPSIQTKR
jgi:hypothetical protein